MGVLRIIGYTLAGMLIIIAFFLVVAVGAAGGAYWYFSRNADYHTIATIPVDNHEMRIEAFSDHTVTKEEMEAALQQSNLRGDVQVFVGPFSFKLAGLRLGVRIPIEEIVRDVARGVSSSTTSQ